MSGDTDGPMVPIDIIERSSRLGDRLRGLGWSCATAESCTGGGIAYAITSVAGASDYLHGSIVAYSNAVKRLLLGVSEETLASFGAVSGQCALEMARGIRRAIASDLGIASTGIAGPGGATARKPVGLVYIAVATPAAETVRELRLTGDRQQVMQDSIRLALDLALLTSIGAHALETEMRTR